MNFVVVLALFLQSFTVPVQPPAVTKSDMPPSISVKMSPEEIKRLENANKALAEAEAALAKAKNERQSAEYEIIRSHRGDNVPAADCQFGSVVINFTQNTDTGAAYFIQPEPRGYLGSINGNWVVFTKGFMECHGV